MKKTLLTLAVVIGLSAMLAGSLTWLPRLWSDLHRTSQRGAGGRQLKATAFVVALEPSKREQSSRAVVVERAAQAMRRKLPEKGIRGAVVNPLDETRVLIEVPASSEAETQVARRAVEAALADDNMRATGRIAEERNIWAEEEKQSGGSVQFGRSEGGSVQLGRAEGGSIQLGIRTAATVGQPYANSANVVLVEINEESLLANTLPVEDLEANRELQLLGSWPWPRRAHALILDKLLGAGAKVVGFNLLFSTPSQHGPEDDGFLREALKRANGRVVIGASCVGQTNQGAGQEKWVFPTPEVMPEGVARTNLCAATNLSTDGDGMVRELVPRWKVTDKGEWLLAMSAHIANLADLREQRVFDQSSVIINYRCINSPNKTAQEDSFPRYPYYQLFYGKTWNDKLKNGEVFKDKIVLIGPTRGFLHDTHLTPGEKRMSGIEIHAAAINTLVQRGVPLSRSKECSVQTGRAGGGSIEMELRLQKDAFVNSLGMKFVSVPGTAVLFCIWETRVQDYQAFASATGRSWKRPSFEQGPTHPAVNVRWEDAKVFCEWLTQKERQEGWLNPSSSTHGSI